MSGYVQVYTGNGKGKTTAAFGLTLRSVGAGRRVFIGQFVKGRHYSELDALERFADSVTICQYGRGCFIKRKPVDEDITAACHGLEEIRKAIQSGAYDMVIVDEGNIAVFFGLITVDDLLSLIDDKPEEMELVITGRYAHERLIERADLVTEMREVKHYYREGVLGREGIEL